MLWKQPHPKSQRSHLPNLISRSYHTPAVTWHTVLPLGAHVAERSQMPAVWGNTVLPQGGQAPSWEHIMQISMAFECIPLLMRKR